MNLLNDFAAKYRQGDVALPANCVTFAAICVDDCLYKFNLIRSGVDEQLY